MREWKPVAKAKIINIFVMQKGMVQEQSWRKKLNTNTKLIQTQKYGRTREQALSKHNVRNKIGKMISEVSEISDLIGLVEHSGTFVVHSKFKQLRIVYDLMTPRSFKS